MNRGKLVTEKRKKMFKLTNLRKPILDSFKGALIDLEVEHKYPAGQRSDYASVEFGIYIHKTRTRVGYIDLRFGDSEELYYAGNVGYRIQEGYRGHGFAYEACLLLFQIAKDQYQMQSLIITCSPDNVASRKTIEKLGGTLIETVEVPSWHWLAKRGETIKNIYSFTL